MCLCPELTRGIISRITIIIILVTIIMTRRRRRSHNKSAVAASTDPAIELLTTLSPDSLVKCSDFPKCTKTMHFRPCVIDSLNRTHKVVISMLTQRKGWCQNTKSNCNCLLLWSSSVQWPLLFVLEHHLLLPVTLHCVLLTMSHIFLNF